MLGRLVQALGLLVGHRCVTCQIARMRVLIVSQLIGRRRVWIWWTHNLLYVLESLNVTLRILGLPRRMDHVCAPDIQINADEKIDSIYAEGDSQFLVLQLTARRCHSSVWDWQDWV
jgi:hypothetical protein